MAQYASHEVVESHASLLCILVAKGSLLQVSEHQLQYSSTGTYGVSADSGFVKLTWTQFARGDVVGGGAIRLPMPVAPRVCMQQQ
jgi:hypothetical protein